MFKIYYAGNVSKPEVTEDRMDRTDWGNLMVDLRMGYKFYLESGHENITPENLNITHTHVHTLDVDSLEDAFMHSQGEFMSDEVREKVISTGATHTSMSVGDIAIDSESGEMFICDPVGWTLL